MILRKKILFLAAFLVFAGLATFFLALINQPYYNSGIQVNLKEDGFHITKVASDSSAEIAGLTVGMVLEELNGTDAIKLSEISNNNLPAFLKIATRIFQSNNIIRARSNDGRIFSFESVNISWLQQLSLLNAEIISNIIIGILFIAAGVWLLAIGKENKSVRWFAAFCIGMGPTIGLSFFISYWSPTILALRFIGLDLFGITSLVCLVSFVHHFPEYRPFKVRWVVFLTPLLPILKYVSIGLGLIEAYGPAMFLIHIAVALALPYTIVLLILQYKNTSTGGKRRIRWILTGLALSLVPYVLYMLSLIFRANFLTTGTDILNFIASYAILLFPITVGIGVVKYRFFDIDEFLNRFTALAFLTFCFTITYTFIFIVLLEKTLSLEIYILLLLTALVSPWAYKRIEKLVDQIFWKGRKDKRQILTEMEQELVGVTKKEEAFPVVSAALLSAFYPVSIEFIKVSPEGQICEFEYPKNRQKNLTEDERSVTLSLGKQDLQTCILKIGRKRDDDIYTKDDLMLLDSLAAQLSKVFDNCELYQKLQESLLNESRAQRTAILSLAKLTEYRDNETGMHLERIQEYSRLLALQLQTDMLEVDYLTDAYIDDLCLSSILHDIGKVGIPDHILLKPGKLEPDEFEIIKHHPLIGGKVLEDAETHNPDRSFLAIGKMVAYYHHEKWDGSGYPFGLKGDAIPLSARIVAVADVYDALRSDRPYKKAFTHEKAIEIIIADSGTHFDPILTDALIAIENKFASINR